MSPAPTLLIRADSSPEMGAGHVMRCLAMAQAWQDSGGKVVWGGASQIPAVGKRIVAECAELQEIHESPGSAADAAATSALANTHQVAWVVVDGYQFSYDYQRAMKGHGHRVLLWDDNGEAGRYCCELVLNQNAHASEAYYQQREAQTQLLLGTRFAQIRRELWPWRQCARDSDVPVRHILVTLGGSDPSGATEVVLDALRLCPNDDLQVTLVVGGGNPRRDAIAARAAELPSVRLVSDAPNMPELMAEADLAVSAGGSTCWELALMGLPALVLIAADNQERNVRALERQGAAINLGWTHELKPDRLARELARVTEDAALRQSLSGAGREMVDGYGPARVGALLRDERVWLRPVARGDTRQLWEWANDPLVRAVSFRSDPIPWEDHVRWLDAKLADPRGSLYLALTPEDRPVGLVRFDRGESHADISIVLGQEHRGRGLGVELIRRGAQRQFQEQGVQQIDAYIKPDNAASVSAFTKAGFQMAGETVVAGNTAIKMCLHRNALARETNS